MSPSPRCGCAPAARQRLHGRRTGPGTARGAGRARLPRCCPWSATSTAISWSMAAIYERTMQRGTTQRLVDNLRRAVAGIEITDGSSISVWDARTAIEAAGFLADDEIAEADGGRSSVSPRQWPGCASSAPVLQADLEHRRSSCWPSPRRQFEDVLAAISVAEQRAVPGQMSRFIAGNRFIRGWIALQRGQYEEAAGFLAEQPRRGQHLPRLGCHARGRAGATAWRCSGHSTSPPMPTVRSRRSRWSSSRTSWRATPSSLLGDRESALREAEREVVIRRRYGPRYRLAQALRRRASFEPARQTVGLLAEAVELAESTPRRAVTARVLASYGAALRRVGRILEAREVLVPRGRPGRRDGDGTAARTGAPGAGACRRAPASHPHVRAEGADRGPTAGGAPGVDRVHQPPDRRGALRDDQDRRDPSRGGVPKARHQLP